MTVIIVAENKDSIFIGSDKQVTWGDRKRLGSKIDIKEINSGKDKIYFANAGSSSLSESFKNLTVGETYSPEVYSDIQILYNVFNILKEDLIDKNLLKSEGGCINSESPGIIVFRDKKYLLDGNFLTHKVHAKFESLGCGEEYAIGYLEANSENITYDSVKSAIECACKHDIYCGMGYDIIEIEKKK